MIAFASSLDQGGLISQSAEDAAMVLGAMSGFDPRDSTSVDTPVPNYVGDAERAAGGPEDRAHQGVLRQGPGRLASRSCIREALKVYEKLGAKLVEVKLPALPLSVPTYYVVAPAECSSNLARFDGVRYGYRCEGSEGSAGPLQALARRGLRRRGQAPHHDRHLRAVGRLLRRLLPQGAARASAHQPGLQARLRRGRRADRARPRPTWPSASARKRRIRSRCTSTTSTRSAPTWRACRPCRFPAASCATCPWDCRSAARTSRKRKLLNVAHAYQKETDWHRRMPAAFTQEVLS